MTGTRRLLLLALTWVRTSSQAQSVGPLIRPVAGSYEVVMFASTALGAVMPRLTLDLMFSTSLAEFQSAVGSAVAKGAMLMEVAALLQSVLHSVEGVHLFGILLRAQLWCIRFLDASLGHRLGRSLAWAIGGPARFHVSITYLLSRTIMNGLVGNLFVTLFSISGQATLKLSVDAPNRFADATKTTEMEPCIQTVTVLDSLAKDMSATALAQSHSMAMCSFNNVEHLARKIFESNVEGTHVLDP